MNRLIVDSAINNNEYVKKKNICYQLGILDYEKCLMLQNKFHKKVEMGFLNSVILIVQHPEVLTLGKNSKFEHIHNRENINIVETERGGQVTAHNIGQLIVYPIISIKYYDLTVRKYITILEDTVIEVLKLCGITSRKDSQYPGVWIGDDKVCSIGIRVKNRVTLHGIALNVSNKLDIFDRINPCGIVGRGVCKVNSFLKEEKSVEQLSRLFLIAFSKNIGINEESLSIEARTQNYGA